MGRRIPEACNLKPDALVSEQFGEGHVGEEVLRLHFV
jgi:hypothetical protein